MMPLPQTTPDIEAGRRVAFVIAKPEANLGLCETRLPVNDRLQTIDDRHRREREAGGAGSCRTVSPEAELMLKALGCARLVLCISTNWRSKSASS
jgi:hypothetical protein